MKVKDDLVLSGSAERLINIRNKNLHTQTTEGNGNKKTGRSEIDGIPGV